MKIQRKLAGFSACALVLSSLTVPVAHAAEVNFKDIDSHWAKSSIERWAGYEVVNGMGNNQFKPEDTMTRAQMAQILSKTLGLTATATTNPFTDVKDSDWFKDAILKCNAAGIMNGTSATTAKPDAPISRQDAVTMMSRALGIEADGDSTSFDDNGSIGNWAIGFVNAMAKRGIVNGRSEGMFAPTGNIKRGEIATILDRAITTYVNTPNTEVTASAKGITLIAASGVTVKGEAEDILVAPAATGTTKLDSVKVSGAVTMQAANGTLVLGGTTTAAKLNIPALATGAKVTIEKDATVAAVSSSADNVAIDGNGTITAMTVETGKGVTVAGSVKVGKITNNSQDSMKHGNNVIAGVGGTTPTVPSGGGSGSSGNNNNGGGEEPGGTTTPEPGVDVPEIPPVTDQTSEATVASTDDFVEQAQQAATTVTAKMDAGIDSMGSFTIVNDAAVDTLNLDLNEASAGTVAIRAKQAKNIKITGSGKIAHLTIEAPNATVTNEVETDEADVEKVGADTYHAKKTHKRINMKGKGHLKVESDAGKPVVNISTPNKTDKVKVEGAVETLNVNSAVKLLLDHITETLNLISSNKNVEVTVNDSNTGNITLSGSIGSLTANKSVTLSQATVTTATVANDVTIDALTEGGVTTSNIGTLTAQGNVTVNASVQMLTTSTTTTTVTVGAGAVVTSVTTTSSVTLAGGGRIDSVDVNTTSAVTITKSTTVTITQVTALGTTKPGDVNTKGEGSEEWKPAVKQKAAQPTGIEGKRSDTWNQDGSIDGANADMEYRTEDGEWNGAAVPATVPAGTYFVRVAAKDGVLASEPVRVVVPAQVGVTKASIMGSAIVGQKLTATPNPDADDVNMTYAWSVGGESATKSTDDAANELTVMDGMVGKTITVTISNYDGSVASTDTVDGNKATSNETEAVTADMTAYNKALKAANAAKEGVVIDSNAAAVPKGMKFVTQAVNDALETAITNAAAQIGDLGSNLRTMANVAAAATTLTDATATYEAAKQDGQGNIDTAQKKLTETIEAASKLFDEGTLSTENGLDKAPTAKWYSSGAQNKLNTAISTARGFTSSEVLTDVVNATDALAKAMKIFRGQLMNGAPIDVKALDKAVADALANVTAVEPATSADQMYVGTVYVPQDAINAYRTAIATAMSVTANPDNQKAVLNALDTLNEATAEFNVEKIAGTTIKGQNAPTAKVVYSITADTVANVTLKVDKTEAGESDTVTVTATPAANYTVTGVTVTGQSGAVVTVTKSETSENTWTFVMPAEAVTVSATVVTVGTTTYTVTITQPAAGATLSADKTSAAQGDTVTITATPADGYTVTAVTAKDASDADVTVNQSETEENTWTFTMPAYNVTVTATATMAETKAITSSVTYTVGDDTTTYTLASDTGIVTLNPTSAGAGTEVEITVDSSKANVKTGEGTYTLASDSVSITLTDTNGTELDGVTATPKTGEDNVWTFTMPDPAVEVKVNVVLKYTKQ